MEYWHKITLPYADSGVAGKGQRLKEAFMSRLMASGGQPKDAAMFWQQSEDFKEMFYYFSPGAMRVARLLIEGHGAVPCPAPLRGTVNLAAGDAAAFELLWPSPDRDSSQ
jgi:hypothetical protein